ncbi:unnamed protein product [Arabidopsis arenosa]|uniref:F-box domain-containing protein n=1 Tax=Arabidopsis arenosa TaxID=38785 RepID=A0A8S2ACQ4_ARAAE|nr:unnamed protein product [Arabidopsis arenosa]
MKSMEKTQKLLTNKHVALSARKEIKRRRSEFEKIHIPNDIVEEIMVMLPVKSLMRFLAVSKHWRSFIMSKDFEERYMALEQSKECKLLLVSNYFKDKVAQETNFSLKTVALEPTSASVVDEKALKFEKTEWKLYISESCDGLVCLYAINIAVKVVNPATKMYIELPLSRIQQICMNKQVDPDSVQDPNHVKYPRNSFSQFGFGKDSVTGRYKLVWLYNTYPFFTTTCEVLDLEEKTWRFVNTDTLDRHNILNHNLYSDQGPVFADGSIYWLTGDEDGYPKSDTKLIVFDIHTEMFQVVETPTFITSDCYGESIGLCNLHGHLCISELMVDNYLDTQEFWWRVKDNTWEKIFSVHLPSTYTLFGIDFPHPLTPLAICRDTNKVILALRGNDNLVALDLNPHSSGYHLYLSCYNGLAVPYVPSLSLFYSIEKET